MKPSNVFGLMLIVGSLSFGLGVFLAMSHVRREAIAHGFAQYNPTNAVFEWKTFK